MATTDRDKALVANAADPKQVRHASRREKRSREQEIDDLRATLSHDYARRVLWRLMSYCAPLESPAHPRADVTQQNIGKGDVGRMLISEINEADDDKWLLMQREARARVKAGQVESEAVRTQSTGDDDEQNA